MLYTNEKSHLIYDLDAEAADGIDIAQAVRDESIDDYRVRLHRPGPMLEIEAYPVFRRKAQATRARRAEKTKKAQEDINDRNARMKLDRIIQHNFPEWDSFVIGLDYEIEPTPEQAEKDRAKFIRDCRALYKAAGIEFKWVAVTPWLTKTGRPVKRLHHHIVMSGGVDEIAIRALWMKRRNGRIHLDPLQPDSNGVTGLSRYLHAHLHGSKRWTGSRNLETPPPIYPKRHMSKSRAYKLAMDYEAARTIFETQHKDYSFVTMEVRFSDAVDGAYIYVRMRRKDAWSGRHGGRHGRHDGREHKNKKQNGGGNT
ncbi:MAG: hypothetical protein EOM66_02735 [Clostridia bacterium]|nr:hypothetical protein [Clostridia bacterium]